MIEGHVGAGLGPVRDAFAKNFDEDLEGGAAFAVWRDGEVIVDLWGGEAAADRAWRADSLQLIFSGSKGLTAICMMLLLDRRLISLDAPASRYWPAFGKPTVLVRDILSHTCRLPGLDEPTTWDNLVDSRAMAAKLERQPLFEDPRCALTYHPLTFGWLCGELLRKVDGRSLGQFFAEEIARPLDLEIWFGLPGEQENRVTTLALGHGWRSETEAPDLSAMNPTTRAIWYNPQIFGPNFHRWNERPVHAAEIPAVGAIGAARSIAKLYGVLASGGEGLVRAETIRLATTVIADGFDVLNNEHRRFGAGFALQAETTRLGPPHDAFGHGGAGGSMHGAWPTQRIGFSYAMNRLHGTRDPRSRRILDALHTALG